MGKRKLFRGWLCLLAGLALCFALALAEDAPFELMETVSEETCAPVDITGDEDPAAGYINQMLYPTARPGVKKAPTPPGAALTEEIDQRCYLLLRDAAERVAAGQTTSTVFTFACDSIYPKVTFTVEELGVAPIYTQEAYDAASAALYTALPDMHLSEVQTQLLYDCPYALYWYDKTLENNFTVSSSRTPTPSDDGLSITLEGYVTFRMYVSKDYSLSGGQGTYQVNPQYGQGVAAAVVNAQAIVDRYEGLTNYQRLAAYKNEICDLTSYNNDAALNEPPYGDPWQVIWVFDDDPLTTVVCEGYAKAFKYLNDLSQGSATVITPTGYMHLEGDAGGERHMWNIVAMDDGLNYLVDVTNCDSGMIGSPDGLFLVGYDSGNVADGYTIATDNGNVVYTYDADLPFSQSALTLTERVVKDIVASGDCGDNLAWTLDSDGVLTIYGTGEMRNFDDPPFSSLPVYTAVIEDGVASIGNKAFEGCSSLTSVTIPSSVTSIGCRAFMYCHALSSVTIAEGVTSIDFWAFNGCASLTSVTILEGVTSMGKSLFTGCSSLTDISVSGDNTAFSSEDGVLYDKTGEELITYPPGREGSFTVPSHVVRIADSAFEACYGLTGIAISNGVTSIGEYAFGLCTNLAEIEFPASLTTIGNLAFEDCASLTVADIPFGVTSIGVGAFRACTSLVSVFVPDSVTSIGGTAFAYNPNLVCVTLPFYDASWLSSRMFAQSPLVTARVYEGSGELQNALAALGVPCVIRGCIVSVEESEISDDGTMNFSAVTDMDGSYLFLVDDYGEVLQIWDGDTYSTLDGFLRTWFVPMSMQPGTYTMRWKAGWAADYPAGIDCVLEPVTVPEFVVKNGALTGYLGSDSAVEIPSDMGVTAIANGAFADCASLTSVTIPEGVTTIGETAFYGCYGLMSVTIPESVISIGETAFFGCGSLQHVYYGGSSTQWAEIAVGDGNEQLDLALIHLANFSAPVCEFSSDIAYFGYSLAVRLDEAADAIQIQGWDSLLYGEGDIFYINPGAYGEVRISIAAIHGNTISEYTEPVTILFQERPESFMLLPADTATVEEEAFRGTDISRLYIPSSVESIGAYAFADSESLRIVQVGDFPDVDSTAFDNCPNVVFCVPSAQEGFALRDAGTIERFLVTIVNN